ncbi:MAG: ATP-dependent RNA helicase DeaD [Candidatus Electronema aureum]|uniref:ATP-dependent RNA helicase DeaD n=1 Tax=Candidatus Electronema aureum TaxID=2005002 RepID=A0A521FYL4_9BACT|nr:MAG: ATP-dependent RNA helicase DeaD [Candidatus Electronema aureum]
MSTFAELGISSEIITALSDLGFTEPTPIQVQAIPLILKNHADIVSLAQTGTGKTAAFGLPLIQLIDPKNRQTQGLVLCPTRELCMQVSRDLESFARHIQGINIVAIYGGASIEQQMRELRRGAQIIVATPGRLRDMLRRKMADIAAVRFVVLDEADEMLNMGFQEELNGILSETPAQKNTLLFSATMSREVAEIASKYMSNPVEITVGARNAGSENISHEYYLINPRDRYPALKRILDSCPDIYAIIFCRTRMDTQEIADKLIQDGYKADALHGDLTQSQRDLVMKKFHARRLQLLVATDVAARGLDVSDLTHVINYSLPDDTAGYTHRSGRTGRAGRTGISVALVDARDMYKIKQIEGKIKRQFRQCAIPGGQEICRKQLVSLIERLSSAVVDQEQIEPLYAEVAGQLEHLDKDQLVKKIISLEFGRFMDYYRNAPDINPKPSDRRPSSSSSRPHPSVRSGSSRGGEERKPYQQRSEAVGKEFAQFHLNIGRRNGILPENLISTINEASGGGRIKVGKIEIMRNTAMLEGESRFIPQILQAFQQVKVNGKPVDVKVVQEKPAYRGDRATDNSKKFRREREQHR